MEAVGYEVFKDTPNLSQIVSTGSIRPDVDRNLQNQVIQIGSFLDKIRNSEDKAVEDDVALFTESQKSKFNLGLAEIPDWTSTSEKVQGVLKDYDTIVAQASLDYLEQNKHRMTDAQYKRSYTKLTTQLTNGMTPYAKELGIARSKEGVAREVAVFEQVKTNVQNYLIQAPIRGQGISEQDITDNILMGLNRAQSSPFMNETQKVEKMLELVTVEHDAFLQADITDRIVNDIAGKYYGVDKDGNRVINYEQKLTDLEKTKELLYNNDTIQRDAQKYYQKYGKKYGMTEEDFSNMIYQQNTKFVQEAYPKIYNQVVKAQDNDLQKRLNQEDSRFKKQSSALASLEGQLKSGDFLTPVNNASGQNFQYSDIFSGGLKYKDITVSGEAVPLYTLTHNIEDLNQFRSEGGYVQMPDSLFEPIKIGVKSAQSTTDMDTAISNFYYDSDSKFGKANKEMMKKSLARSTSIPLELINVNDPEYKKNIEDFPGQQVKDETMKKFYLMSNQMGINFEDRDYKPKTPFEVLGKSPEVMGVLMDSTIALTAQEQDVLVADMILKYRYDIPGGAEESKPNVLMGMVFGYVAKNKKALADLQESRDQILRLRKKPEGKYQQINKDRIRNNANSQILKKYPLEEDSVRPEINPIVENAPANTTGLSQQQKQQLKEKYFKNGGR